MALIKCPECNNDISDKAKQCIHCGYSIKDDLNRSCLINGKIFDLSFYKKSVSESNQDKDIISELSYQLFNEARTITIYEAEELLDIIITTGNIPKSYNSHHRSALLPVCPKCGSTAITTGARGINWTWGLIGASKTVNRCGSCGYSWRPQK